MEERLLNLGFTEDDLLNAQLEIVNESIAVYNETYGTNYTIGTVPIVILSFIVLNTLMTLNGWNNSYEDRFDTETLEIIKGVYGEEYKQYGGISSTNTKILEDKEETPENFVEVRTVVLFAGLFVAYQITQELIAKDEGKNFIGAITRRDGRVRPTHRPNDNRFWKVGTQPNFAHDYGCRCTYFYFISEQEAREAGFNPF